MARIRVTLDIEWREAEGKSHPSRWDWAWVIDEPEVTVVEWEDVTDDGKDEDLGPPMFTVVGEGTYDPVTDELEMRREP